MQRRNPYVRTSPDAASRSSVGGQDRLAKIGLLGVVLGAVISALASGTVAYVGAISSAAQSQDSFLREERITAYAEFRTAANNVVKHPALFFFSEPLAPTAGKERDALRQEVDDKVERLWVVGSEEAVDAAESFRTYVDPACADDEQCVERVVRGLTELQVRGYTDAQDGRIFRVGNTGAVDVADARRDLANDALRQFTFVSRTDLGSADG